LGYVTYTISDGNGGTATALVTVTVTPVNDPPVAFADAYIALANTTLSVAAPGVLGNDLDVENDVLGAVLVSPTAHGNITLHPNGSFSYVPATNYIGPDSFTYLTTDAQSTGSMATVSISVIVP